MIAERVYAPVSDDRIVVVSLRHSGEGKPSVDVTELLPVAVERAAEVESDTNA